MRFAEMVVLFMGIWAVVGGLLNMVHLRRRAESSWATPEPEPPPRLDWCDGCDQIRPSRYMGFTEGGLYRCALCRGEEEPVSQEQYWEARKEWRERAEKGKPKKSKVQAEPILGRKITLDMVYPGQAVIAEGNGAKVIVHGKVSDRGRVTARGNAACIVIGGHIGNECVVTAEGNGASVTFIEASPSASVRATGNGASVRGGGRSVS